MKTDLKTDLILDVIRSAAKQRRGRRILGASTVVLVPMVCVFFLLPNFRESQPTTIAEKVEKPELNYETINTEEELLARLAHLGPVIVTRDDGSRWLYLTENQSPQRF